jgi:hypothetical protein
MGSNGYVTFVNNNPIYLELTNILVESVLNFYSCHGIKDPVFAKTIL